MSMFCFQCQETANGTGCTIKGVCGKSDQVAQLQDVLIYVCKGISIYSTIGRVNGIDKPEINSFIADALFTTITNANFDKEAIVAKISNGLNLRDKLASELHEKGINFPTNLHDSAKWNGKTSEDFLLKAPTIGVLSTSDDDIRSLKELLVYGLKGIAAYGEHAGNLGYDEPEIWAFVQKALAATTDEKSSMSDLLSLVMESGSYGVKVMALLDKANTSKYGNPEITKVNIGVRNNPAILISGHDLTDMEALLEQTKGTGVDVYTHSEMLPAHYYPAFKKYDNFVGNYGNAWWKQREEFETFNGPILFTSNCIVPIPTHSGYKDKVFTTNSCGFEGCKHIVSKDGKKDFSEIIALAKTCNPPQQIEEGEIIGGFAHNQVFALANKIVDAVKSGAIRKFFVMAGCDGRIKNRDYYTEFASKLPKDTVILTAGCAKYRYNKLQLGDINGIPRVLDAGQCNDSYSLAVIALKLKEVFQLTDINDLPISYNIAWYEQKAVIVLLALLSLGVKNIHLGPTLPGFLSPNVAKVLVEQFGLSGILSVDEDMKIFMPDDVISEKASSAL